MSIFKPTTFPPEFLQFLEACGVAVSDFMVEIETPIPRFIRINPKSKVLLNLNHGDNIKQLLDKELETIVTPIPWLDGFYSLERERISNSKLYTEGHIYGMDVASGVAVQALGIEPNEHILELCCAPGNKLCMISDIQASLGEGFGSVTGVDIDERRLSNAKNLLKKYKAVTARLFLTDGTTFDVRAPTRVGSWKRNIIQSGEWETKFQEKPFFATRMLRQDPQLHSTSSSSLLLYDKVLVDAECTHDGSISHIRKQMEKGWQAMENNFMDREKLASLETLQRRLISNGFRLLKPGGILVYSTCSLSRRQNEYIVKWLLMEELREGEAQLVSIPGIEEMPCIGSAFPTDLLNHHHMRRFSPRHSGTSALFIARILKRL